MYSYFNLFWYIISISNSKMDFFPSFFQEQYIINPNTKRIVVASGPTGRKLLRELGRKKFDKLKITQEERDRLKNNRFKCDSGFVWSSLKGNKCYPKDSPTGKEINKCQKAKTSKIMTEFQNKTLYTNHGEHVTNVKQALAIAYNMARRYC